MHLDTEESNIKISNEITSKNEVYLMPVLGADGSFAAIKGLVLAPTGRADGDYYRLGAFRYHHFRDEDYELLLGPAQDLGHLEYETCQSTTAYTIKLV